MRSPQEIVDFVNRFAVAKAATPLSKLIVLGILGGVYISMGAMLSIVVGHGFPAAAASNVGLVKILMGATFPIGLIMIVLAGAELFTGCCAYFVPNVLSGRQSLWFMVKYCSIVWVTNFLGALLFGYLCVYLPEISHASPVADGFATIAQSKMANSFYVTLLRGIGANWLVCLAIWLGISSKSVAGKILGLWIPVMTFVAIGYEHSVANMFFIPVAIMEGASCTWGEFLLRNLIPATLGNIIGGALFVGCAYWYIYDNKEKNL